MPAFLSNILNTEDCTQQPENSNIDDLNENVSPGSSDSDSSVLDLTQDIDLESISDERASDGDSEKGETLLEDLVYIQKRRSS